MTDSSCVGPVHHYPTVGVGTNTPIQYTSTTYIISPEPNVGDRKAHLLPYHDEPGTTTTTTTTTPPLLFFSLMALEETLREGGFDTHARSKTKITFFGRLPVYPVCLVKTKRETLCRSNVHHHPSSSFHFFFFGTSRHNTLFLSLRQRQQLGKQTVGLGKIEARGLQFVLHGWQIGQQTVPKLALHVKHDILQGVALSPQILLDAGNDMIFHANQVQCGVGIDILVLHIDSINCRCSSSGG
mmetsp:Transcript_8623/g.18684  ORF Transcript_8623/g.18684 Transcript_8623/m.18684 type:complete len:241 (-) Transcript_8623:945-1667(-)